ncbi:ARV1-like protein [Polychaeton citri CBS 116435]|uniref:Protein ARV n=1 Tax=Polychaeton citri CBS 116435 TaxID=1314669 RepID=A0A9P4UQD9_9PEZI|nr:ARV1-like protein [Polychaeton citri CBS 116435]
MPICIECRYPIGQLYTTYSKADDKALGKGVRLTQCPRCKKFADKYVEHDFVVLFIDLVLIKPQVYRHLLYNRLSREDDRLDPSILRLAVLLLMFDVYLTWARIEKASPALPNAGQDAALPSPQPMISFAGGSASDNATLALNDAAVQAVATPPTTNRGNLLSAQPILLQYFFFLVLCAAETIFFHLPIRTLCSIAPRLPQSLRRIYNWLIPYYPHPALISTGILVSSFTKLFPLLLLIWRYDLPSSASAVSWAVIINNVAALEILLDCGYMRAVALAGLGAVCRAGVGWGILRAVGIAGGVAAAGVVETGDVIELWRKVTEHVGVA